MPARFSAVFMRHLLALGRRLKLLSDEAAEQLDYPVASRCGKSFPQRLPGKLRTRRRRRRKKAREGLRRMRDLLALWYDEPGTRLPVSEEQRDILLETWTRVDAGDLRRSSVCPFCNRHKGTDVASIDADTGRVVR